ncbi:hypothetical protein ACRS7F_22785 [Brucella anthropi]|uniref:DUF968 domain-containing protein n=1 Tax=Brucella anthropi TaxID=529 RepID=UPI003EE38415
MAAAFRMPRYDTAFSLAPAKGKRRPRIENGKHLAWIRTLPCTITGQYGVEAAHIRYAAPHLGKRDTGKAEKPDDRWTVPLSPEMHREQHSMNEQDFWQRYKIDPCQVAMALHGVSGDDEAGLVIIRNARMRR